MSRVNKIKFGGSAKMGGSVFKQGVKTYNSPDQEISIRDIEKNPKKYIGQALKMQGAYDWVDKEYNLLDLEDHGQVIQDGLLGKDVLGNHEVDFSKLKLKKEIVSGSHISDEDYISNASYKLRADISGEIRTTRSIMPYFTSREIQYVIDQDIESDKFLVSTYGDINQPSFGPYMIQSKEVGGGDFFEVVNNSHPENLSGFITGYEGNTADQSLQILSLIKTGITSGQSTFKLTNLDPLYPYSARLEFRNFDLKANIKESVAIETIPISGASGDSITINFTGNENSIKIPETFRLYKYIKNATLLTDRPVPVDDKESVKITGVKKYYDKCEFRKTDLTHAVNYPIKLNLGEGEYSNDYWFLGGPENFTGHKDFCFKEISLTGNSDLLNFYVTNDDQASLRLCSGINLSNNENLQNFHIDKYCGGSLTHLNLSGCKISGQNFQKSNEAVPFAGDELNSLYGLGYQPSYSAITRNLKLQYLNLNGNALNETGISSFVLSCLSSSYSGQKGTSGFLDIRNQSGGVHFNESNRTSTKRHTFVLDAISKLSGQNWIVEYDKV